jgi:hypothetical protein
MRQLHSYLQYIGLAKYGNAAKMLQKLMDINLEKPWKRHFGTSFLFLHFPPTLFYLETMTLKSYSMTTL